jgi:pyruvate dehydrogenase (quinone)
MDEMRRQKTLEWVHVRHEEVAAFAASADGRTSPESSLSAPGVAVPTTFI